MRVIMRRIAPPSFPEGPPVSSLEPDALVLPHRWPLPDGSGATLRRIAPEDLEIEVAFLAGLSPDTSYNRLFSTRHPGRDEVVRWTNVDLSHEEALVVTGERDGAEFMRAVARYVRDDDGPDAEFAIVVGDAWKRCGLGRRLICGLVALARRAGVRELYGSTLSTNVGMLALGHRLGFASRRMVGDGAVTRLGKRLQA